MWISNWTLPTRTHRKVWRFSTCCCGELWTPHVTQCCQRWLFHVASRETAESHAHIIPYVSARREDYTAITKSTVFPLSFCGHRWLENQPVIERALEVWPSLTQYMDAVRRKQLPNPGTASFDTVQEAMNDTLIIAKLHFSLTVARLFSPFLKRYQTDEPVMPFLSNDLAELIKVVIYTYIISKELLPLLIRPNWCVHFVNEE